MTIHVERAALGARPLSVEDDLAWITSQSNTADPRPQPSKFLRLNMRCVVLRLRLITEEVTFIGALHAEGLISDDDAWGWVDQIAPGCLLAVAEGNLPEPDVPTSDPERPKYRTAQATIDAFWHVARDHDPAYLARWLADHPEDAPFLRKLWEKKCKTQSE